MCNIVLSTAAHCSHEASLHWSENSTGRPRRRCSPWVFLWGNHFINIMLTGCWQSHSHITPKAEMKQGWNVPHSIFRSPIVRTGSMTPSFTLCKASRLQVGIVVRYKQPRNVSAWHWCFICGFSVFRWQHFSAFHLSGTADPASAESHQLLPLQGVADDARLHRGRGLDHLWKSYPPKLWAGLDKNDLGK